MQLLCVCSTNKIFSFSQFHSSFTRSSLPKSPIETTHDCYLDLRERERNEEALKMQQQRSEIFHLKMIHTIIDLLRGQLYELKNKYCVERMRKGENEELQKNNKTEI